MQNFGKIKNAFNGILAEGLVSKNDASKLLFKKYIKTIKESEILKTQFLIYNNIENAIEVDSLTTNLFIQENLRLLEKFNIKDIIKENKKLVALLDEAKCNLDESYDDKLSSLHESLSNYIFMFSSPKNLNERTNNFVNICKYIKGNSIKENKEAIELPSSMLTSMMVDKYNEKYSSLDESEKSILKSLIDSTPEQRIAVYTTTVRECIDLINEKLNGSDLDAKDKLLRVKDKLLNDKIDITEEFEKKISKLVDLKDSLK